jgi:cell wall-associated NlpC family hydrolase
MLFRLSRTSRSRANAPTITRRRRWLAGGVLAVALAGSGLAPAALAAPTRVASAPAVALASQYKGVPYKWGGTSTRGFDCSGYVQYVFRKLGVKLPRTAEAQWQHVEHIKRSQLRPGDLVFWGRPYGVYHVGIYAGGNKVWNAPHTGSHVRLEKIWGGAKLYGRVRGLQLTPHRSPEPGATAPTVS